MSKQIFTRLVLTLIIIVYIIQIIIAFDPVKSVLLNPAYAITAGIFVYIVEVLIAMSFLKTHTDLIWKAFNFKELWWGITVFLLVFGLTTLCVQQFDQLKSYSGYSDLWGYLHVFLLNSIPGAMSEEWLFRFLPVYLVRSRIIKSSIPFYLLITFAFMLMHVPKYVLANDVSGLFHVFISGIVLLLIYLLTQNLPFVILIHAFTNYAWFVYNSTSNWFFLYVVIVAVTLVWGLINARYGNKWKRIQFEDYPTS